MFGISGNEILIILLIAILVVKPEDLPRLIRQIGRIYGQIMRVYYSLLDEINSMDDLIKK
jgi:sec-independent protein translocase protein TatB